MYKHFVDLRQSFYLFNIRCVVLVILRLRSSALKYVYFTITIFVLKYILCFTISTRTSLILMFLLFIHLLVTYSKTWFGLFVLCIHPSLIWRKCFSLSFLQYVKHSGWIRLYLIVMGFVCFNLFTISC